jgi:hypothetical protein
MAAKKKLDAGTVRSPLAKRIVAQRDVAQAEIGLERLEAELGDVSRYDLVASLRELEKAGAGRFVVDRKGRKSRFIWSSSAGPTASGAVASAAVAPGVNEAASRPRKARPAAVAPPPSMAPHQPRSLQHSFHVRPGVLATFDLPADITPTEIERLCQLLKAIPFG